MNFEKVRKLLIKACKEEGNDKNISVTSNLNWLRIKDKVIEVSKYIPKNAKVMDIGCGHGHITIMLSLARPDIDIVGVNPEKHTVWKEFTKPGCRFEQGDGLKLKYKDNSFDVVVSFGVLEHIKELYELRFGKTNKILEPTFIKEITHILKPDGRHIISNLPNKYSWSEFTTRLLGLKYHDNRFTKKRIKNLNKAYKIIKIKKEFVIPAQVYKLNQKGLKFWNRYYKLINKIDILLNKTPLNLISQSYFVVLQKK